MLRGAAPEDGEDLAASPGPGAAVPLRPLSGGRARGRLIGGNLSLVSALEGTPYAAATAGRVLFLEDVGERPYRIDRMLQQLKLAGGLEACAAVILGHFTGCDPKDGEASMSVDEVLRDYFSDRSYPVLAGFPCGHHRLQRHSPRRRSRRGRCRRRPGAPARVSGRALTPKSTALRSAEFHSADPTRSPRWASRCGTQMLLHRWLIHASLGEAPFAPANPTRPTLQRSAAERRCAHGDHARSAERISALRRTGHPRREMGAGIAQSGSAASSSGGSSCR